MIHYIAYKKSVEQYFAIFKTDDNMGKKNQIDILNNFLFDTCRCIYHMTLHLGVKQRHALKSINHWWFSDFLETL